MSDERPLKFYCPCGTVKSREPGLCEWCSWDKAWSNWEQTRWAKIKADGGTYSKMSQPPARPHGVRPVIKDCLEIRDEMIASGELKR